MLFEVREFYETNGIPYMKEQLFGDYLKYGGLPMRLMLSNEHSVKTYLEDVYDSIVVKDILFRHDIRNETLLRRLLVFLLDNVGNPFSARSVCRALASDGQTGKVDTNPKYVISSDLVDMSRNGILHYNIIDFLLRRP